MINMWLWDMLLVVVTLRAITAQPGFSYYDYAEDEFVATDCFYEFHSSHRKNGSFMSPLFPAPYPQGKRCHYVFQGQGKERVQISFDDLDLNYDMSNPSNSCDDEDSVIVSIKIEGKTTDIGRYCGNAKTEMLMSNNNRLDVYFISRDRANSARGFKATYKFVTDFGIKSGVQSKYLVCGFEYHSKNMNNGTFSSPNYPGLYPRNTECEYIFYGEENEIVHIQFPFFDVEGLPPTCDDKTSSDYLEFSNFNIPDRKMSRYCGMKEGENRRGVTSDGPYFKVLFKSNDKYDARGFQAHYQFSRPPGAPPVTDKTKQSGGTGSSQAFGSSAAHTDSLFCFVLSTLFSTLFAMLNS